MTILKRVTDAVRWRMLLAGLRLDPTQFSEDLESPGENDFIVAGCPRTGTSLLAAQLHQPPRVVTVMEPWDGLRIPPAPLFQSLRREVSSGVLARGRLDLEALQRGDVAWRRESDASYPVDVIDEFLLGVKWPTYWQLLEWLPETRFLITIRHPSEVVTSFERSGGRLGSGLDYDVRFNRKMNRYLEAATDDDQKRRVLLYEYINSRLLPHLNRSNVLVVRYERWHLDSDDLLQEISAFLGVPLEPRVAISKRTRPAVPGQLIRMIEELAPSAGALGYDPGSVP